MPSKKKKPIHSSFSNAIWSAGNLVRYSPTAFVLLLMMVPIQVLLQYLNIYLPSLVVSEIITKQTTFHALHSIGIVMAVILLGNLIKNALEFIKSSKLNVYRYKMANLVTKKKLGMFYQLYERKEIHDLGNRAEITTQMWDGSLPLVDMVDNGFGIVQNILGYFLFGTVISFVSPWLVLLLTIAPVINLLCVHAYNKWEYSHRDVIAELNQKLWYTTTLSEDFSTAKDIRVYSLASWITACYRDLSFQYGIWEKKTATRNFLSRIADLLVILIRDGGAYALLISMVLRNELTVDQFVLYFAAVSSFATWVGGIIDCWNKIHASSLQICDYREFIDYPDEDGEGTAQIEDILSEPPEIIFDKVCFRYDGAQEDTIHNLSFTLHKGEKVALVGLNGAGKTTIVKLLCGLYKPTSGEIRINGILLSQFRKEDYYRLISPVFQDVKTAFFSLAETVSGQSADNTDFPKAEACMRKTGLGSKLDSLPNGIHTKLNKHVNPDGIELSGGEVQKLMMARALYKDAPLLVLDEPTAALDPIAESQVYTEYHQMTKNKTSLFISHRLASTSFCDRIFLLENGSIAEEGTHEQLFRKGGRYRQLFEIQSCWYQKDGKGGLES